VALVNSEEIDDRGLLVVNLRSEETWEWLDKLSEKELGVSVLETRAQEREKEKKERENDLLEQQDKAIATGVNLGEMMP